MAGSSDRDLAFRSGNVDAIPGSAFPAVPSARQIRDVVDVYRIVITPQQLSFSPGMRPCDQQSIDIEKIWETFMLKKLTVSAAVAIAAAAIVTLAPPAGAQPDTHVPNGVADWCPGGQHPGYGGQKYCLGEPFADGTFYAQTWSFGASGPFAPGAWHRPALCSQWINGGIQGAFPNTGPCGGGPQHLYF